MGYRNIIIAGVIVAPYFINWANGVDIYLAETARTFTPWIVISSLAEGVVMPWRNLQLSHRRNARLSGTSDLLIDWTLFAFAWATFLYIYGLPIDARTAVTLEGIGMFGTMCRLLWHSYDLDKFEGDAK